MPMARMKKTIALSAAIFLCAGMAYAVANVPAAEVSAGDLSAKQLDLKTRIAILVREKEQALRQGDQALADLKQIEIDKLLRQAAIEGLTDIELNAVLLAVQNEMSSDRATYATDGGTDWRATDTSGQPGESGSSYRGPAADEPETPGSGYRAG